MRAYNSGLTDADIFTACSYERYLIFLLLVLFLWRVYSGRLLKSDSTAMNSRRIQFHGLHSRGEGVDALFPCNIFLFLFLLCWLFGVEQI